MKQLFRLERYMQEGVRENDEIYITVFLVTFRMQPQGPCRN